MWCDAHTLPSLVSALASSLDVDESALQPPSRLFTFFASPLPPHHRARSLKKHNNSDPMAPCGPAPNTLVY